MATIGKKLWPPRTIGGAADSFARHRGRRRTAGGSDLRKPAVGGGREQDHAVATPRTAAPAWRTRQVLRVAAGNVDPLQAAAAEKAKRAAVWRPEWIARAVGSLERLRLILIQRSDPQSRDIAFPCRDKRELPPVGRHRK